MTVLHAARPEDTNSPPLPAPAGLRVAAVALSLAGVAHALLVAGRYHVGSFDDDAGYVLAARALAQGGGFTTKLTGAGTPLAGVYPPGFALLEAPVARLGPHSLTALRILPLLCFVALFPLTWRYLGRRRMAVPWRLAVLALLALNPVLATYATMVMPETAFVVVLLLLLLAVDRWEADSGVFTGAGIAVVVAGAGLLWLKEAGVGLIVGLVAWFLLRRLWRRAVVAALGPAVLFLPVLLVRAGAGGALIGSRYASDLGGHSGGIRLRLTHMAPHALGAYGNDILGSSIVGIVHGPLDILLWTAPPLVVVGLVAWLRYHAGGGAGLAVVVYLATTLVYPFINERRVVLILPLVLTCYVLGAATLARIGKAHRARCALLLVGGALILVALIPQLPRDYLYNRGQDSSAPGGSPYMAMLRQLGRPADVVETDYLWTTGLFTGHATSNRAYQAPCDTDAITAAIAHDQAGFLLSAALNRPDMLPSPCLIPLWAGQPGAVRLYRSPAGDASIFELVGPGTAHPTLAELIAGQTPTATAPLTMVPEPPQIARDPAGTFVTAPTTDGAAAFTWQWGTIPRPVTQVSLGAASATLATTAVSVELRDATGQWRPAGAASGPVGATAATRYLLAPFPLPVLATAVRVTIVGQGTAAVHDLHVL